MNGDDVNGAGERDEVHVRVQDDGGVRTLVLDKPAKLNVLTRADLDALIEAVATADGRAIIITGAGDRAFCGGMDLATFADLDPDAGRSLITAVRDLLAAVRTAPVPTAAMVNGYCLGIGFELALVCDVRVAVPTATFGLPEVHVGIPSIADAALLSQFVGLSLARELTLTGDPYPVEAFAASGLLNRVVEPEALEPTTRDLLGRISRHTPAVVAAQKRLFEIWQNHGLTEGAARSVDEFAGLMAEPSTHQQIAAATARLRGRGDAAGKARPS